jgi:hypothetical protein
MLYPQLLFESSPGMAPAPDGEMMINNPTELCRPIIVYISLIKSA